MNQTGPIKPSSFKIKHSKQNNIKIPKINHPSAQETPRSQATNPKNISL